ncbi:hypothetical protein V6N13_106263 [Hibiscus sabdariffa]|uniref:Uncharacterized protein n=1 Tax=Hibiscus sabdariffa TaxID=183260 RepID=A0ABR2F049_9ROSI
MVSSGSLDSGQILSVIPRPVQPFEHYENCDNFWDYDSLSCKSPGSIYAFAVALSAHFSWESYYVFGSTLWCSYTPESVESLVLTMVSIFYLDLLVGSMPHFPTAGCVRGETSFIHIGIV